MVSQTVTWVRLQLLVGLRSRSIENGGSRTPCRVDTTVDCCSTRPSQGGVVLSLDAWGNELREVFFRWTEAKRAWPAAPCLLCPGRVGEALGSSRKVSVGWLMGPAHHRFPHAQQVREQGAYPGAPGGLLNLFPVTY
jgi:hypothetical protein